MNYKHCPACDQEEAYYDGEEVRCNNCGFTTTITNWEHLIERTLTKTPIEEN